MDSGQPLRTSKNHVLETNTAGAMIIINDDSQQFKQENMTFEAKLLKRTGRKLAV